jgi:hypothetical protein
VAINTIKTTREHRLVDFVLDLDADMRALDTRLDVDFVKSAEFARRVESVLEQVGQAGQTVKRNYYRQMLMRSASTDRLPADDWELMKDMLDRVTLPELRVLAGIIAARPSPDTANMQMQWDHLRQAVSDLTDTNLAQCWDSLGYLGILGTRNVMTGNAPPNAADEDGLVTNFGLAFAAYIGIATSKDG